VSAWNAGVSRARAVVYSRKFRAAFGATFAVVGLGAYLIGSDAPVAAAAKPAGCGTTPYVAPGDPDHVLQKLPKSAQANYNGYGSTVYASAWSHWKPKGKLTVAVSWSQPVNDFAADTYATLVAQLKQDPRIGKVIATDSAGYTDVPAQIQQYQTLLQEKPDLIIADVAAGAPFVSLVTQAGQEGIPTISTLNTITTKYSVNVVPNTYLAAVQTTETALKEIGDKGNVLEVQGIPGLSINTAALDGFNAVIQRCPNVTTLGPVTGDYSPAAAQGVVQQFIATNPQPIAAVLSSGGMSTGIITAFQQAGRAVPPVAEQAATKGTLGYWLANKSSYKGSATGGGALVFGSLAASVAERMIAGDGVKVTDIAQVQPLITDKNIGKWANGSWTLQTPGTAPDPPGTTDNSALLKPLFNK
jgi:ribose transport system substrate-binding protein